MSHDCDCYDCQRTDSRWEHKRKREKALVDDCPRGFHCPELLRCTLGDPDSAEYWCAYCKVRCTQDGQELWRKLCDEHPRYRALRKPRGTCEGCWRAWIERKDRYAATSA